MLGIGFIGTGGVAERHAEALRDVRDTKLVGVYSPTAANRRKFAENHGVKAYDSAEALVADPAVGAVFVLSTPQSHVDYALMALAAGKHVLVEKPVGRDTGEIARLRDVAGAGKLVCMPSHNYIYAPEVRRLHHHLGRGKLGRLQSFWMLCNQRQTQAMGLPGIVLSDMMVHLVYASLLFCGRPERLSAVSSNVYFDSGADDQVGITLAYKSGVIATLWASWATEDMCREPWTATVKVMAAEGSGVASWDNVKNNEEPQPGWDDSVYWDSFLYAQRFFVEDCVGRGAAPLSTLDDALAAQAIIDAAGQSLRSPGWVSPKF
ncbi:MAG: Gfo/Idh/MocA family oxidoreductase [Rhizobiales bacterium]|nr:Gfo/Idh/MocA family oxidoreductase [Hyphomicrobiales bacterium]MBI3672852.1 Gfo/Idh/MocA family oxidoreductase [Hyphomicrobiales bacterium]